MMKTGLKTIVTAARFAIWRWRDRISHWRAGPSRTRAIFSGIYASNLWNDKESLSGTGSSLAATTRIRSVFPELFADLKVRRILEAPCGDFVWMKELASRFESYIGVDIVPDLIQRNERLFGSSSISFRCADICEDELPPVELILCRDCFIHLPTSMIYRALNNFRRTGAAYLLLTNCAGAGEYFDIPVGSFRPIDLRRPPFSFPDPLTIIHEVEESGRQLCLWNLSTLPL